MLKQLNKWLEVQRTCRSLEAKSDRLLADMGIERADIPLRARGLDPADPASRETLFTQAMRPLNAYIKSVADRRRIRRELSAYRDAELAEIGISRSDIPAIARGDMPAHA